MAAPKFRAEQLKEPERVDLPIKLKLWDMVGALARRFYGCEPDAVNRKIYFEDGVGYARVGAESFAPIIAILRHVVEGGGEAWLYPADPTATADGLPFTYRLSDVA